MFLSNSIILHGAKNRKVKDIAIAIAEGASLRCKLYLIKNNEHVKRGGYGGSGKKTTQICSGNTINCLINRSISFIQGLRGFGYRELFAEVPSVGGIYSISDILFEIRSSVHSALCTAY